MRRELKAIQSELAEGQMTPGASTLVNRNVTIGRRRTSLRLEPAMWDALEEICRREEMSQHELCAKIDERRCASSLTAAIRVFIVNYFRAAATEAGHASIGHGALYKTRARTGGPRTGGPRTGGPRTGGPRTGGPRTGGPRTGGRGPYEPEPV